MTPLTTVAPATRTVSETDKVPSGSQLERNRAFWRMISASFMQVSDAHLHRRNGRPVVARFLGLSDTLALPAPPATFKVSLAGLRTPGPLSTKRRSVVQVSAGEVEPTPPVSRAHDLSTGPKQLQKTSVLSGSYLIASGMNRDSRTLRPGSTQGTASTRVPPIRGPNLKSPWAPVAGRAPCELGWKLSSGLSPGCGPPASTRRYAHRRK
jgi:hypothetical protein